MGTSIDRFLEDERRRRDAARSATPAVPTPVAPPAVPPVTAPATPPRSGTMPPLASRVESARILGVPLTPLQASEVLDLSARSGLPTEAVIADREAIARRQAMLKAPTDMVLRQAPHLSEWMAQDPARAALVAPDLSQLSAIEYAAARIRTDFTRGALRDRMTDPVMRIMEGRAQLDDEATVAMLQKQIDALPYYDDVNAITRAVGTTAEQLAQMGNSLTEAGGALAVGYGAATIAQRAGPMGFAVGTTAKKLMGPLFVMGQVQASGRRMAVEAFLEYRNMKDERGNRLLSDEEIKGVSMIVGALGGALEVTGMASIAKAVPGLRGMLSKDAVKRLLTNPTTRGAFLMYARGVATGAAGEGVTEGLQTLTQQFGGKLVEIQGREAFEGATPDQVLAHLFSDYDWGEVAQAAGMGATVGVVLGGATGAVGLGLDIQRARQAEAFATQVEQVVQTIAQTGVAKTGTPEQLADLLGALIASGQKSVWLDSQAFTELFQTATDAAGNPINPSDVAAMLLDGDPTAYESALADSGASFEVPISEVLGKLAVRDEGMRAWVLDNIQQDPMAMSRAEARAAGGEALTKRLEEINAEAEAQAADPKEQLLRDIEQHVREGLARSKQSKRMQRMAPVVVASQFRTLLAQGVPLDRVRQIAIENLRIYGQEMPDTTEAVELSPEQQASVDAAVSALEAALAPEVDATGTPVPLDPAKAAERRREGMIALGEALAPPTLEQPAVPFVEQVSVAELAQYREFARTPVDSFIEDIAMNGIREPLLLEYSVEEHALRLTEGNTRLAAAEALGITSVPVLVIRREGAFPKRAEANTPVKLTGPRPTERLPEEFAPSTLLRNERPTKAKTLRMYHGSRKGFLKRIKADQPIYLTEDPLYAEQFGETVTPIDAQPRNILDLRVEGNQRITLRVALKALADQGVTVTEEEFVAQEFPKNTATILQPMWAWMQQKVLRDAVQTAGFDAVYLQEGDAAFRPESLLVLDPTRLKVTTILVDGVQRQRVNNEGKPIAKTDAQLRNFWRWFGDSIAVDREGRPLVLYHGAATEEVGKRPWEEFDTSNPIWVSTDPEHAADYADAATGRREEEAYPYVFPLYLRTGTVLNLDAAFPNVEDSETISVADFEAGVGFSLNYEKNKERTYYRWELSGDDRFRTAAIAAGYDTLAQRETGGRIWTFGALQASSVKSAEDNSGAFSGEADSILEQRDPARETPLSEAEIALEEQLQRQRAAIIRARDYLVRKGKLSPEELQALSTLEQETQLPPMIEIDGAQRPTTDSTGWPIALTEAAVRNFWRWFGDSKVVDDQGRPLVVYHGTSTYLDFKRFRVNPAQLGIHVGTTAAQTERFTGYGDTPFEMARVYPLYARAERPLRLQDKTSTWNARGAGRQLVALKIITPERLAFIAGKLTDAEQGKLLREEIRKAGYDSVVYLNRYEGTESPDMKFADVQKILMARESSTDERFKEVAPLAADSFILLNANQVKSAYGNSGQFSRRASSTILEQRDRGEPPTTPIPPVDEAGRAVLAVTNVDRAFEDARLKQYEKGRELKVDLQQRALDAAAQHGLVLTDMSEKTFAYLAEAAFADAQSALRKNRNAVGWYNEKVKKALAVLSLMHPELATDEDARFAFVWAMATTSNGLKVDLNFELANKAYTYYRRKGVMPTNIGIGTAKKAINNSLAMFNTLKKKYKIGPFREFATTMHTVAEVKKFTGRDVSGEWKDTLVYGAAAIGPKIGNGFFANLYGHFEQLTIDRWMMRTWGRWQGTLIVDDPQAVAERTEKLTALVAMLGRKDLKALADLIVPNLPPNVLAALIMRDIAGGNAALAADLTATLNEKLQPPKSMSKKAKAAFVAEQEARADIDLAALSVEELGTLLEQRSEKLPFRKAFSAVIASRLDADLKALSPEDLANGIKAASASPDTRTAMTLIGVVNAKRLNALTALLGPEKKNSPRVSLADEIRKMGNGLWAAIDGQQEIPRSPLERAQIRRVMQTTLERLQRDEPSLTMADLQALLWYPEKKLYDVAKEEQGAEGEESYSDDKAPDYANSAVKLALAEGISQADITETLTGVDRDIAETARAEAAGRAAGTRPGARGAAPSGGNAEAGAVAADAAPEVLNQAVPEVTPGPLWYSALERAVMNMKMPAMPANDWWSWLVGASHKTGVKREELEAVGVQEFLALRSSRIAGVKWDRVTKQELLAFIRENGIVVEEGMTGDLTPDEMQRVRDLERQIDENDAKVSDIRTRIVIGTADDAYPGTEMTQEDVEFARAEIDELERESRRLEIEQEQLQKKKAPPRFTDYAEFFSADEGSYHEMGLTLPNPPGATKVEIREDADERGKVYRLFVNGMLEKSVRTKGEAEQLLYSARVQYQTFEYMAHAFRVPGADINRIAHVRFSVQRDANGNRVLYLDEIQSDWAQQGRKSGFATRLDAQQLKRRDELLNAAQEAWDADMEQNGKLNDAIVRWGKGDRSYSERTLKAERAHRTRNALARAMKHARLTADEVNFNIAAQMLPSRVPNYVIEEIRKSAAAQDKRAQIAEELATVGGSEGKIPSAPFVEDTQSWTSLVLKRMIRYAAENGIDRIAWTTGADQVRRYERGLRNRVDKITWTKTKDGIHLLGEKRGQKVVDTTEKEDMLSDAIGKAMADRIVKDPAQSGVIEGEGITIDDTGMASFYDHIIPSVANGLLKKLGGGTVDTVAMRLDSYRGSAKLSPNHGPKTSLDFVELYGLVRAARQRVIDDIEAIHEQPGKRYLGSDEMPHEIRLRAEAVRIALWLLDEVEDTAPYQTGVEADAQERAALENAMEKVFMGYRTDLWSMTLQQMRNENHPDFATLFGQLEQWFGPISTDGAGAIKASFAVTDAMRETAIQGLPLFQAKAASSDPRGRIYRYPSGRFDVQLLAAANESTFMHEMAHFFLAIRTQLASEPGAPAALVADLEALDTWLADDHQALRAEALTYLQTAYKIEGAVAADGTPMYILTDPRGRREAFADEQAAKLVGETRRAATLKDLLSMDEAMIRGTVKNRTIRGARADSEALLSVAMEERFARGFELYLREGKAPSLALRNIFSQFAAWLTKIYRQITQLNVTLTPEVRAVMDRMLATEEEIAQAQASQGERPLFSHKTTADLVAIGFSEADAAKYVALLNEAKLAAHEDMRKRLLEDLTRLDQKWWKDERKRVEKLATDAAHAMPIYRAWSLLQTGRLPDGTEQPGLPPRFKLDRDAAFSLAPVKLVDGEPRSALEELQGRRVYEKNGLNPDLVAGVLGYPSGQVLIDELLKAQPMREYIQAQTDAKMNEIFPPNLEQAADVAVEALHSTDREAVLRHELKVLAKMNLKGMMGAMKRLSLSLPEREEVVALAKRIIGRKPISALNAHEYLQGEAKAAKLSAAAVTKGDWLEAIQQKQRQILNHALWREATAMKAQMKKDQQLIGKVFRSDARLAKSRDMNLVNVARTVLARVGLGRGDAAPESYLEKLQAYDPATYDQLQPLLNTGVSPRTDPKTLTVEEYRDTMTVVEAFWMQAKGMKDVTVRGRKVALEDVVTDLANDLEQKGDGALARAGHSQAFTKLEQLQLRVLGWKAALRRVESWVDMMDGGNPNGVWRQYIWEPISEAGVRFRLKRDEMVVSYKALLEPLKGTLTGKKVMAPELGYTFKDKAELLGALLHTGNRGEGSNFDKLIRGRASLIQAENAQREAAGLAPLPELWTEDNFDRMVDRLIAEGTLTAQDFAFLQGVWDLFESRKADAQKVHHAMVGYYFNEVTATPITNQFGTFRGGYFPARADGNLSIEAQKREDENAMKASADVGMFPTPPRGFTKNRSDAFAAPLVMDLDLVVQHIDAVELFIAMSVPSRDVQRILLHKGFAAKLKAFDPALSSDMLAPWVQRSAKQTVTTPTRGHGGKGFDALARFARGTASLNAMVANVVNTLQQATGLSIAMLKVKPRYLAAALVRVSRHPKDMAEMVNAASEFMRSRNAAQLFEARAAIEKIVSDQSIGDTVREAASKHGYFMQVAAQNFIDNVVWIGANEEALAGGADPVTARRTADAAVRLTQGSFAAEDVSRAATGNAFMRVFTMYFDYFNMQANVLGTEIGKLAYNGMGLKQNAGRAFFVVLMGFTIPAFVGEVISAGMRGDLPDDEELEDDAYLGAWLSLFFQSQHRTATAMVPIAGQVAAMTIALGNDKVYDDRLSVTPVASLIESAGRGIYASTKLFSEEEFKRRDIKDILSLISVVTRVPLTPLARPTQYLYDVQEGATRPTGPVDFTRGILAGR